MEYKFRAWDKENKEMLYQQNGDEGVEFNFGGTSPTVRSAVYYPHLVDGECIDDYVNQEIEDPVIMQFTGLLDKNGKEIYEGDIVQKDNEIPNEINFYNGCFGIVNKGVPGITRSTVEPFSKFPPYDSESYEVIGNIYENEYLLKRK